MFCHPRRGASQLYAGGLHEGGVRLSARKGSLLAGQHTQTGCFRCCAFPPVFDPFREVGGQRGAMGGQPIVVIFPVSDLAFVSTTIEAPATEIGTLLVSPA